jgi:lysophospholipase L1-like esterase
MALTWVKIANLKGPKGDTGGQGVAGDVSVWKANTAYIAGQAVLAPGGDIGTAKVNFTSGSSYSASNWNASGQDGRIGAVEAKNTTQDSRLTTLEGYNAGTRLTAVESKNSTQDGRLDTLEAGKWAKGDIGSAVDFNTITTSGFRGILSGSGMNQPAPNVGPLETKTFGTGQVDEFTTWETKPRKFIRSNFGGSPKPWNEYAMADQALIDWRQAYRYAGSAPAQILAIGDSITEGTGTTTLANRWQTVLQSYLRRQQTPGLTGATFPFIPAKYATTAPGQPVTQSGAVATGYGWGFGWRVARIEDATGEIVFTFTGTSATLMYTKTTLTGVMAIQVDGGTAVIVDTNGTTNNAATWSTGALGAGTHTVRVTRDPSSAAGQYPYIQGLLTYNGDETRGVRVVDAAKHGVNSGQLTQANADNTAAALKAAGTFGAVIIGLGTNDYSAGVSALTYRDNILRQIASLRATLGGFNGSVILLNMYMGGGRDNTTWAAYGEQLSVIAAADPKVKYVDLRWDMPDVPTPTTDPAGQGMYSDTLHPSDFGHRKIAGVLAKVLAG